MLENNLNEELPKNKRRGVQKYYMEDDSVKRIFISKRKWKAGSRVLEKQTGRYRIYIDD